MNVLQGLIEFTRLSHAARYRSERNISNCKSHSNSNFRRTPRSVSSEDSLSIRVFDSQVTTLDRFTSMADRKPDKGFTAERSFDTITFNSQAGYEKEQDPDVQNVIIIYNIQTLRVLKKPLLKTFITLVAESLKHSHLTCHT